MLDQSHDELRSCQAKPSTSGRGARSRQLTGASQRLFWLFLSLTRGLSKVTSARRISDRASVDQCRFGAASVPRLENPPATAGTLYRLLAVRLLRAVVGAKRCIELRRRVVLANVELSCPRRQDVTGRGRKMGAAP